jgi:hypothetical protein
MMDAMHGRGHKKNPEAFFEPPGHLQAAVVKLSAKNEQAFKKKHSKQVSPEKKNQTYFDDSGYSQLTNMETGGGGYIHVKIGMVNPMETPQKGYHVCEQVPHVKHKIHDHHCGQCFYPVRHMKYIEYTEMVCHDILCGLNNSWGKNHGEDHGIECTKAQVDNPSFPPGDSALSVRNPYLQEKKNEKTSDKSRESYQSLFSGEHDISP